MKFDYVVSNPPFKLDFSDFRNQLDTRANQQRFFAGIPNVPKKAKDKMAIYLLFLQHIIFSLKDDGRAAVVVPTGFVTAQTGIAYTIRKHLVYEKMLSGVVMMPSNIFATTGTNVSILFLDLTNQDEVLLVDASKLGEKIKEGKNQKTVLQPQEEQLIIETFNSKETIENFSVSALYLEIEAKNYSLNAGQYFDVKIEYQEITKDEFTEKIADFRSHVSGLFTESRNLEDQIDNLVSNLGLEERSDNES
jgi:type I restriction enzyme M protein